jgi:transposase
MDATFPECPGCVAAAAKLAELERRNAALERQVRELQEAMERLNRSAKRQAAPFSRALPKTDPKKPGRKPGPDYGTHAFRAAPETIDETYEAPLPEQCPRCGGRLVQTHIDQQYQVEIPRRPIYRQFHVAVGRCTCCHQRVRGRHPLQTSNATGCCASQIGPQAQAAVVMLNKELGLSQGKISRFLQMLFGIQLTRGGSCQIMLRSARRCQPHYDAIVRRVQSQPWLVPDETGWRIGGWLAWLHVAVTQVATAYLIATERGRKASVLLLGPRYAGTLIHDGWSPYDQFCGARHQTCLAHLLRRCHELLELAQGGAVHFPRKVKGLLGEALALRDQREAGTLAPHACAQAADGLESRIKKLLHPCKTHPANERFARHLWNHWHQLFTFLRQPGIDATNYRAEQAIRPAVVNRKVWGGNRTPAGATAQAILMTILVTARQNGQEALEFFSRQLCSIHLLSPPMPEPR